MVFNPALPQIATVTSEALQLKIRQLLPSQDGFGVDLAAQNVIVPVIDLTAAAQGSDVPEYLQTALNFGGATEIVCLNNTVTLANSAGFYRFVAGSTLTLQASGIEVDIEITDGATTKTLWKHNAGSGTAGASVSALNVDLTFYVNVGETLQVVSNSSNAKCIGSVRQVADNNGTLVQPVGFTPQ